MGIREWLFGEKPEMRLVTKAEMEQILSGNYLKDLHEPYDIEEEKLKELQEYLNYNDIVNHVRRIASQIMHQVLGDIEFKIERVNPHTVKIVILKGKLQISNQLYHEIRNRYDNILPLGDPGRTGFGFINFVRFFSLEEYPAMLKDYPLFYETYEMDDEGFELWWKLQ